MTYEKSMLILNGLRMVDVPEMEAEFNITISRDILTLEEIETSLLKAQEPSKQYELYLKGQKEINIKYADKDDDGNPKAVQLDVPPGAKPMFKYIVAGDGDLESDYTKEMMALMELNKKVIETYQKQIKSYNETLDKEVKSLELLTVQANLVPKGLSRTAMNAVLCILEDTSAVKKK